MPFDKERCRLMIVVGLVAATSLLNSRVTEAHKPITSKYTYNEDVFPILRAKCGGCHVKGGVAPMSLMTYEEAFPWAESIRVELIASHMPPGNALPGFGALKHADLLTATELDTLLTWATGGNPRGTAERTIPPVSLKNEWALGRPDVTLRLPEVTIAADTMELTRDFTVATGTTQVRWLRAVDLLPGTPSVVRSAVIGITNANGPSVGPEQIYRWWLPGQEVESVDRDGTAFKLPPGQSITVHVHYKKTWQAEGQSRTDASAIGLYFAEAKELPELLAIPLAAPSGAPPNHVVTFARTIDRDVQALALSPDHIPSNVTITASATLPTGTRIPLLRARTRPDWDRRYWFQSAIAMPAGTKIDVVADLDDPDRLSAAAFGGFAEPKARPGPFEMHLSLDVIPHAADHGVRP